MGIFGKPDEKPAQSPVPARPSAPTPERPPAPAAPAAGRAPAATPAPSNTACVIGPKTVLKGEITGDEDLVVEGTVEGQVRITRDVRVGPGGTIKATVEAQSLIVSGEVVGDCVATTRVEILASGRLVGNIRAPKIVIQEGAIFRGNSDMNARKEAEVVAAPPNTEKKVAIS